jgi:multidrug efflux pump subunit AcrB
VNSYEQFLKNVVVPRLEAIPGVGSAQVNGIGAPTRNCRSSSIRCARPSSASRFPKVANQISNSDDISGGTIDVGRRQYELSFRGRYSVDDLKGLVLEWRERQSRSPGRHCRREYRPRQAKGSPIRTAIPRSASTSSGPGANVLATVNAVKAELQKINDGPAKEQGVTLAYSFDPSHFIYQAVGMVTSDLIVGILLAVGVLWFFMREWRGTLIIASAIPICLFAVILLLDAPGAR